MVLNSSLEAQCFQTAWELLEVGDDAIHVLRKKKKLNVSFFTERLNTKNIAGYLFYTDKKKVFKT